MLTRSVFEEEHNQFRDMVRKFLETEAKPYHSQWENAGIVSREIWQKAGELGMLSPTMPEAYGGVGVDFRYNAIVTEEVSRAFTTGLGFGLHSDIVVPYIYNYGSEAQRQKYLPGCINGDIVTAIAMTEPGTGSDLQGIKTTAIRDGDEFVLNGSKTFITNGQMADVVVVVAKTDPAAGAKGISLLIVETGTPGFERGANLHKLGLKAQDTSELFFDNCRIPAENILGDEGKGFIYLMKELPQERLSVALTGTAQAEAVLEETVRYVKERKAFGGRIADFQNTQFKLAEMDAQITQSRVFIDHCLALHIAGKLDEVTAAKAKLLASDLQCKVADECLQLHGGYGFMWEYPVCRAFADARVQRIYAGTNEIMKLIISRKLLAG